MSMFRVIWSRLRALVSRSCLDAELDEELRYHLDREIERQSADGLSPREARAAALRAFGRLPQAAEACRDARGIRSVEDAVQDLRYAIRMLRRTPALTAILIGTLAIGIGVNTALFSIFDAVLLKALPFPHGDRLVVVSESRQGHDIGVSYPDYLDWRARQTAFDDMAATMIIGGVMTGGAEPDRVFGRAVNRQFFTVLGAPFAAGRGFTDAEDRPGGNHVVVLSYALWQRRFAGDAMAIGRSVLYNGEPYALVGVLGPRFDYYGSSNNDFFLPLGQMADSSYMRERKSRFALAAIARVKPAVGLERARADLGAVAAGLAKDYPASNTGIGVGLRSLLDDYVGDVRWTLAVLLAAAALVLTIACANIANLLLARAGTRSREIAVRVALGAGRGRILRQLLTESLLLAVLGGVLGIALGRWGASALATLAATSFPRLEGVALDWRVLAFASAASLLAGILFGLAPAWQTARVNVQPALKDGTRGLSGGGHRLRDGLVVAEVAIAIALLVGAGLLSRSFARLMTVDPGYDARGVTTMRLRMPDANYPTDAKVSGFLRDALARIQSLPGVEEACLTTGVPFGRDNVERYATLNEAALRQDDLPTAIVQWVSAGFHRTLGVPLLAGRLFQPSDNERGAPVAIVDEDFARQAFPRLPLSALVGQRVTVVTQDNRPRTIVGVVRHLRHGGLEERRRAEIYGPYEQMDPAWRVQIGRAMDIAIKSGVDRGPLIEGVKGQLRAIDPDVPLSHVHSLQGSLSESFAPRVLNLTLIGAFAGAGLLLCVVGIYGVVGYTVTERTREIGVRLALGAEPRAVLALVLGRGIRLAFSGVLVGLSGAYVLARGLRTLLFDVTPADPLTFAAVGLLLTAVAVLASYIPARRAMRLDPAAALRDSP